jgi:hypothetical protein
LYLQIVIFIIYIRHIPGVERFICQSFEMEDDHF